MSAHSHVTRIQMLERAKNTPKYAPVYQENQSIISGGVAESVLSDGSKGPNESVLSTGSRAFNPRTVKQSDMRRAKSQDIFIGQGDASFRGSSTMLSKNYAPSMRSLKMGSAMGQRINSKASLASMSRSLGASKASIASQKSTIQQEYHDIKVRRKLNAPWFGVARKPFLISIILFVITFVFLFIGVAILILRGFWNIFLSHDIGDIIGPLFVAMSILSVAFGIKFMTDAYRIGGRERGAIKFRADNANMVEITRGPIRNKPNEKLLTGTNTKQAISRTLQTSRGDFPDF